MEFAKYQGCGNDFILLDERETLLVRDQDRGELAKILCNRNFGVGATSFLYVLPPADAKTTDVRMRILEADTTESNMCGNGIRCVADYVLNGTTKDLLRVETGAGIKVIRRVDGGVYEVDMGLLARTTEEINRGLSRGRALLSLKNLGLEDKVEGIPFSKISEDLSQYGIFTVYGTGEPHMVVFVDGDVYSEDCTKELRHIGERFNLKNSELRKRVEDGGKGITPHGCNVNLVRVAGKETIRIRTYERGVDDETLAFGTGASACAAAAYLSGRVISPNVSVEVRGGRFFSELVGNGDKSSVKNNIQILLEKEAGGVRVKMIGPAAESFRGQLSASLKEHIKKYLLRENG